MTVLELTTEGLESGRREGSLVAVSYSAALRGGTALLAGDLALAESDSELVVTELPAADPMAYAVALGWLIETWVERDRLEEARAVLERSGLTGELPELGTIDFLLMARASLAAAEGNRAAAISELENVGRRATRARYLNPAAMDWRSRLATLLAAEGEQARAETLVAEEVELASAFGSPRATGMALRARGALAGAAGIADLTTAAEEPGSPGRARSGDHRFGRAQHARAASRGPRDLYRGMDLAHRAGSRAQVEIAMRAPRETGLAAPAAAIGVDSLTPQELRGRAHGNRRSWQPRDRRGPLPDPADRRDAPLQRLPQARTSRAESCRTRSARQP